MTAKISSAPAILAISECQGDLRPCGFKTWSYDDCFKFVQLWEAHEQRGHGEQAALSMTCEAFGISYMDTEWMEIVQAIANRTV